MFAKKFQKILVILLGFVLIQGCASKYQRIPFTHNLRERLELTNTEMKRLQFYVSDKIILTRDKDYGAYEIKNGKLITKKGTYAEEIEVDKGTPGIMVESSDDWLKISFEENTWLQFQIREIQKNQDSILYYIKCLDIYDIPQGTIGYKSYKIVEFNNKNYIIDEFSQFAYLLIDKKWLYKLITNRRKLPGIKLKLEENNQ